MLYFLLGTIFFPFYVIIMLLLGLLAFIFVYIIKFFKNMASFANLCQKYKLFPWQWSKLTKVSLLEIQETINNKTRSMDNDTK